MSEKLPRSSAETRDEESTNPYEGFDRATLDAVARARETVDEDSPTPKADLRVAVREALEASGDEAAFRRVYDMDNLQLDAFVDGAGAELKERQVGDLRAIIDAYDNNESFGDRRTAIREVLEAAGDEAAFRKIYDMNNLDLKAFVDDAREKLAAETETEDESEVEKLAADGKLDDEKESPDEVEKLKAEGKLDEDKEKKADEPDVEKLGESGKLETETPADEKDPAALAAEIVALVRGIKDPATKEAVLKALERVRDELSTADEVEKLKAEGKLDEDKEKKADEPDVEKLAADGKLEEEGTPDEPDLKELRDGGKLMDEEDTETEGKKDRWWKSPFTRAIVYFQKRNAGKEEREGSSKKKWIIGGLGAIALVGGAIAAWKFGWYPHGGGGNSGDAVRGATDPLNGPHSGGTNSGVDNGLFNQPPVQPKGPELPGADGFNYPWNWAEKVKGAEHAQDWLHDLGHKAEEAGHNVEWHGSGIHQWVEVDGNSNTKHVIDTLSKFAK